MKKGPKGPFFALVGASLLANSPCTIFREQARSYRVETVTQNEKARHLAGLFLEAGNQISVGRT